MDGSTWVLVPIAAIVVGGLIALRYAGNKEGVPIAPEQVTRLIALAEADATALAEVRDHLARLDERLGTFEVTAADVAALRTELGRVGEKVAAVHTIIQDVP